MLAEKTQVRSKALTLGTSVRFLKGVGPEKEKILERLGLRTLEDLLHWFPRRHEARLPVKKIKELTGLDKECVSGRIAGGGAMRFGRGLAVFKALIRDGSENLSAVFYRQPYLSQVFKPGVYAVFYGKAERKGPVRSSGGRRFEMIHPDYEIFSEVPPEKTAHHGRLVPIYPLTEDLTQKSLRQIIYDALEASLGLVEECLPEKARKALALSGAAAALRQIHFPENEALRRAAYERLVFDEFFFLQLAVGLKRLELQAQDPRVVHRVSASEISSFLSSLPFELTPGQKGALRDILEDMRSSRPMNRLIQGDVGSGKTAVAAAALYYTAKCGFQGALMAPTEVLAQQLYFNMTQFLEPHGFRVGYLAQTVPDQMKRRTCEELLAGQIRVAVGTHALLEEKVGFKELGLAVVDEQHKFGVSQREVLRRKGGRNGHFLLMTATPIPRTLAMTLYGDMDISVVSERPGGRGSIRSLWFGTKERQAVYSWCGAVLEEGAQAYIVCPWLDSEKVSDAKNAVRVFEDAKKRFPGLEVQLLHGKMRPEEKAAAMKRFRDGKAKILVSTTLVEVGLDVSNARFMIIENAEKFGLAQLHQLRGRIGRGAGDSFCVILSDSDLPETVERLEVFVETESGFDIAEKDLAQRGAGELGGKKQHGIIRFRIGDLALDGALMAKAKNAAKVLIEKDPALSMSEHAVIKRRLMERYKSGGAG